MKNNGFTLVEMLVVVAIIMIILAVTIPLYNQMFRGQALKQADAILRVAIAQARQYASMRYAANQTNMATFVYLRNDTTNIYAGIIEVHEDTNNDGTFENDGTDKLIPGSTYPLPKYVYFDGSGSVTTGNGVWWFGINPEGYLFNFTDITASAFDSGISNNAPVGDIVLNSNKQPYKMYIDLDVPSGKVRKSVLINTSP